jgi:hypothetical protein
MTQYSVSTARAAALLLAFSGVCSSLAHAQVATPPVDFVRDIKPILEKSCFSCHGAKAQLGGLRLDAKALAMKSIHAGKSAESSLYARVAGLGDQARMPMGSKPLPPDQIQAIKNWIDSGAEWPDGVGVETVEIKKHWAFIPPKRPAPAKVTAANWVANPIDSFVLARLEKEGLKPSPPTDKTTLLRRLSLDLIGLPPTPEEVDAFVADKSKDAYQRQVERLLASPHYGEKWARQWLDAARYADSDGYEKDKARQVWFYRDWVINAFNRDLSYDKFITEQIAGDLLPNPTQDQKIATGFLRNSMINEEGGIDPEQFRMEAMFDRMEAVGKGILGVTIQCAQCHNHKFDPLTQEEYYRLFAFMNDSHEANVAVYTPQEQQQRADIFRKIKAVEASLQMHNPAWPKSMAAWEEQVKANQPEWIVVKPEVDNDSTGGQKYKLQEDGSFLASGYAPTKHKAKLTAKVDLRNITGFRLELMNDPNLPLGGPGRSVKGVAALSEFEVEVAPESNPDKPEKVKILKATADLIIPSTPLDQAYNDKTDAKRVIGPINFAIDGNVDTAWATEAGPALRNLPRNAVFAAEQPVAASGPAILTFYLNQRHGGWNSDDNQNQNLGRFRLSVTTAPNPVADPVPAAVRKALAISSEQRSAEQTAQIFSYWRTTVPEWKAQNEEIASLWAKHPEGSSQLILQQQEKLRETRLLTRGDFLKPAKEVTPGVPSFLNPLPKDAPVNRLTFARWLVSKESPTTARAFVNRVWQAYFSTGLVSSSEDLGKQSEAPSHPELLDWLAVEFMEKGWSMKNLHRTIVNSATYRQSSNVSSELVGRDPNNRLLAHASRMRVEAETVRDIALASSGLLNQKVGGPSVYPPAPDFLFKPPSSYGPKNWNEEKGEDRFRRALYTFRFRSVPYPMLQAFDAPNGDTSCVRRPRSNTPLQALVTLNEPLFLESARALAKKTLESGGSSDAERVKFAFRRVVARNPSADEQAELLGFLEKQTTRLKDGWLSAPDLAGLKATVPTSVPKQATPVQLAAWTALSRVLLNLDEAITKE